MAHKDGRALFLELREGRFVLLTGQTALGLCWTQNKRLTGICWTRLPVALCSSWQVAVSLHIRETQ